jgi:hypothetical protein
MAGLEGTYEQVNQRLASIDLRFDAVDRRFDSLDQRIESTRSELVIRIDAIRTDLDGRIDRRFMWTIGIMLTCWFTTMLAVLGILVKH